MDDIPQALVDQLNALIKREGGYSNQSSDSGGPTRWGVTEHLARQYGYFGDMRDLPRDTAFSIHLNESWLKPRFHLIYRIDEPIGAEVADTATLAGPYRAGVFLQRLLNAFNQQGTLYSDLVVDGNVGPATRGALTEFIQVRGVEGRKVLLRMLNSLLGAFLVELAEKDPSQEDFSFGWALHRVYQPAYGDLVSYYENLEEQ